jgi:hypothetical protein
MTKEAYPARYPSQIIAMVSTEMRDRITREAEERSAALGYRVGKSTIMREYLEAGMAVKNGSAIDQYRAVYMDDQGDIVEKPESLHDYAKNLVPDPDAPEVEDSDADAVQARLRARGL